MTRAFFLLSAVFLVAMIVLFIGGLTSNAPGLLMAGLLLAGPGFVFSLGVAIGRASNEFAIVRKDTEIRSANSRQRVITRSHETLS